MNDSPRMKLGYETMLIDSISSHNIKQPQITAFLGLPIVTISPLLVVVVNGNLIQCTGCCKDIPIMLDGHTFHISFFVLPIHGVDLVLGVQWLQTLVTFVSDFSIHSIQFSNHNKPITLVGISNTVTKHASYALFCLVQLFLLEFCC